MKVFISWSGDRSHRVALLVKEWLGRITSGVKLWLSSEDIARGAQWFNAVTEELRDTSQGIICITHTNVAAPWLLFEAGALSKGLTGARVYTLLIDLGIEDVPNPLAQFNSTAPNNRADMLKLLKSINSSMDEDKRLSDNQVDLVFNGTWSQFERDFEQLIKETEATAPPVKKRDVYDISVETLTAIRAIEQRLAETQTPRQWNNNDLGNISLKIMTTMETQMIMQKHLSLITAENWAQKKAETLELMRTFFPELPAFFGSSFDKAFEMAYVSYFPKNRLPHVLPPDYENYVELPDYMRKKK